MSENGSKRIAPNMRFGASFLDYKKHNKMRAMNDEVMMDKRTGELVYKRNTDGKLLYFAQENFHLNTYIRQIKALMNDNRKTYVRPNSSNCEGINDVYFLSYNIDMIDFEFIDNAPQTLLDGGSIRNPIDVGHSFVQETNGFFIQVNGRPRDRALVSYLTALYDKTYKHYDGEDPEALLRKEMYEQPGYDNSNAVVNYTVSYYDADGKVVAEDTSNGYIRINEVSYVPFVYQGIYPRTRVAKAMIRINMVSAPKLAVAKTLLSTEPELALLEAVTDNEDIGFISCNVGIYISTSDPDFTTPEKTYTVPMLVMGWEEWEEELARAKSGGAGSGILIAVKEPDPTEWEDVGFWGEIIRYVYPDGTEEETDHETELETVEKSFTSTEFSNHILTTDMTDAANYWVELFGPVEFN